MKKYRLKLAESNMFITDIKGNVIEFDNYAQADEERIYLQPDIEERIIVDKG